MRDDVTRDSPTIQRLIKWHVSVWMSEVYAHEHMLRCQRRVSGNLPTTLPLLATFCLFSFEAGSLCHPRAQKSRSTIFHINDSPALHICIFFQQDMYIIFTFLPLYLLCLFLHLISFVGGLYTYHSHKQFSYDIPWHNIPLFLGFTELPGSLDLDFS